MTSGLLATIVRRAEGLSLEPRQRGTHLDLRCPAHDDKRPSLSVDERDGKIVLFCHAGCAAEDVVSALGFTWSDLHEADPPSEGLKIIDEYPYHDEAGTLLYQVVRLEGKAFRQRRPNGHGGWIWNMNGARRVPYRLPEMLRAVAKDPVFVVEGEKDADRLIREGLTATCNPGGAGKWRKEFAEFFRGALVVVIPDNDELGRKHAKEVATSLTGVAKQVKILQFPDVPEGGDVSDFLSGGGTAEEISELLKRTQGFRSQAKEVSTERLNTKQAEVENGGHRVTKLASEIRPERVSWLWPRRIAAGFLNVIAGPAGVGKSTILYDLAARVSREGGIVLIATAEDHLAAIVRPRLEAANADLKRIYLWTAELTLPEDCDRLRAEAQRLGANLVIVDPLVAFLAADVNTHRDASVRQALAPLARMAEAIKAAVAVVLHTNKAASDDPLFRISGSGAFAAAARHVLLAAADPSDEEGVRRVLAVVKSNLAAFPPPLAYRIEGAAIRDEEGDIFTSRIAWGEEVPGLDPRSLLRVPEGPEERSAVEEACEFLKAELAEGPQPAGELLVKAGRVGIASRTLQRARPLVGAQTQKAGLEGVWVWSLPEDAPQGATEDANLLLGVLASSALPGETGTLTPQDAKVPIDKALAPSEPQDAPSELDEATARVRAVNPELYRR